MTGMGVATLVLVGPLPPPAGGMANQTAQLAALLAGEGVRVRVVRSNAPCWPAWVEAVPRLRAGVRLLGLLVALWRALRGAELLHLMANSGWSWHLVAAPTLVLARLRGVPVVVNYRGGAAGGFLAAQQRWVLPLVRCAAAVVVPSAFLARVFAAYGVDTVEVRNVVDLSRFARTAEPAGDAPRLLVARNLEPIYGVDTALRALGEIRRRFPHARLCIAGDGPERARLEALAAELDLSDVVRFVGQVPNAEMPALFAAADLLLNPSSVDNAPIALLEACASGVPVVATAVGGVPDLVVDGESALLVPVADASALAAAACRVLDDPTLRQRLVSGGRRVALAHGWEAVRVGWQGVYRGVLGRQP